MPVPGGYRMGSRCAMLLMLVVVVCSEIDVPYYGNSNVWYLVCWMVASHQR